MDIVTPLFRRFMRRLAATPDGRRFMVSQLVETEAMANGEGALFSRLLEHVRDVKLRRLMERHYRDELRHERILRERMRLIDSSEAAPRALVMIRILERLTRPYTELDVRSDRDVFETYLFIQVLEEHAARELGVVAEVMDTFDPELGAAVRGIRDDEARHVRWCQPILDAHAHAVADPARLRRRFGALLTLARHRHNLLGADWAFQRGLVPAGALVRLGWLGLIGVAYAAAAARVLLLLRGDAPPLWPQRVRAEPRGSAP